MTLRFKTPIQWLVLAGFFFAFGMFLHVPNAWATTEICFCHETSSLDNPFNTICTSDEGLIEGHTDHGDILFGCYCGDTDCDEESGENEITCPQDCGVSTEQCGNEQNDGWEECGDVEATCPQDYECLGCRCVPPEPQCFYDTDCTPDDDNFCNGYMVCAQGHVCTLHPAPQCDDGDACNGVETCDPTDGCQAGTPVVCNDEVECTTDSCDPQTGQCLIDTTGCECETAEDCDDNNVCNGSEDCDLETGCVAGTPLECDDENACNGVETCDTTDGCQEGTPVVCDDQIACSTDSCDPQSGECQFDLSSCGCQSAADCDDGDPCTEDGCDASAGTCSNVENASLAGCEPVPAVNPSDSLMFEGSGCSLNAAAPFTPWVYGMLLLGLGSMGVLRSRRKK